MRCRFRFGRAVGISSSSSTQIEMATLWQRFGNIHADNLSGGPNHMTEILAALPRPGRLREALALNLRERKAIELALRASEFVAESVEPMARLWQEHEHEKTN